MKKIDVHCHVTNRFLPGTVYGDCSVSALSREMDKFEVEKAVVLASYFPHKTSGISNFRMHDWIKGNDRFLLFGSLDFEHYFFQGLNELSELAERGALGGIKIYTTYQKIDLRSDCFNEVVRLASTYDLPMMFHTGYSHGAMSSTGRESVEEMVTACDLEFLAVENPSLRITACHMSKPYTFACGLGNVLERNKNFFTDMSGLLSSKKEASELPAIIDDVRAFVDEFGADQLLFGSDFPVQSYEHSVAIVEGAIDSDKEREKVFYSNARRFLGK